MSLPDNWVDQLFSKLTLTYGQAFMRQYDGLPLDEVKANWAHELGCFAQSKDAIRYGLERLPTDRPPNVLQFRVLCNRPTEHDTKTLRLPAPPANPEIAARIRAAFKRPLQEIQPKDWAWKLRGRELGGEKLTAYQHQCWRDAIGSDLAEAA
jgi:hypothetical protein